MTVFERPSGELQAWPDCFAKFPLDGPTRQEWSIASAMRLAEAKVKIVSGLSVLLVVAVAQSFAQGVGSRAATGGAATGGAATGGAATGGAATGGAATGGAATGGAATVVGMAAGGVAAAAAATGSLSVSAVAAAVVAVAAASSKSHSTTGTK